MTSQPDSSDDLSSASEDTALKVQTKPDANQLTQFVTTIKNAEQQVGEHVIGALQQDNTVAILTTAVMGPDGQQRVVSVGLNDERLAQVDEILKQAAEERQDEEPCVGFHCMVKPKQAGTKSAGVKDQ